MTQKNKLKVFPINAPSLRKRILAGALIGLILITIFLVGAGNPKPEWGKLWMIKPLIIVPLFGAMGGVFNYFISQQEFKSRLVKTIANLLSFIIFVIGLWLGTVLGLNGTFWD